MRLNGHGPVRVSDQVSPDDFGFTGSPGIVHFSYLRVTFPIYRLNPFLVVVATSVYLSGALVVDASVCISFRPHR